jgi:chemotaxis protein MotB
MNKTLQHIDIIKKDKDTIVLRIKDIVLFDQGEATLNPESYPLLRKISDIVRPLPVTMRIEGHTDSTLLENVTMKNWDLSVARAVSVLSFYNQGKLLSLDRISAVGYGDEHPITTSTAEKDRDQNRRVDFVLNLKRASEMSSEQSETVPF